MAAIVGSRIREVNGGTDHKICGRFFHLMTGITLTLITLLLVASGCCLPREYPAPIRIYNHTDQTLSIFINDYSEGDVAPGTEIMPKVLRYDPFRIQAKNAQGDVVYSQQFRLQELEERMDWKVVIPPLQSE